MCLANALRQVLTSPPVDDKYDLRTFCAWWNRGYKSWEILEQMTQPVKDFPCYICGEAYSTNQTWVEGALQTAEIVLQKHLGLAKPGWVTQNPTSLKPPAPKPKQASR